jgi:hypothetical protein
VKLKEWVLSIELHDRNGGELDAFTLSANECLELLRSMRMSCPESARIAQAINDALDVATDD